MNFKNKKYNGGGVQNLVLEIVSFSYAKGGKIA